RSSYVVKVVFRRCWQTSDGPLGLTGTPGSGPPFVRVRRPACWAGGHLDEAEATHAGADRSEAARGRPDAQRGHRADRGVTASRGLGVELESVARAVRRHEGRRGEAAQGTRA